MKILFFQWNAYMQKDIMNYFNRKGIDYEIVSYNFRSVDSDDFCARRLPPIILAGNFDCVFSLNFLPFLAEICHKINMKYVSWTYDSPLSANRMDTLAYPGNYAFFFDRYECERFWAKGLTQVFHLPLAMDAKRLDAMEITDEDREKYTSDICFIGKIYQSDLTKIYDFLPAYDQGYLTGICHAQQRVYGYNFINDMLPQSYLNKLNTNIILSSRNSGNLYTRQQYQFTLCTNIAHMERMEILTRLGQEFPLTLYSPDVPDELIDLVDYRGTVYYSTEMPKAFRLSRINLNITLKSIESGIPLRCIDILGCGGFLMSNYQPELVESFENGKEIVCYESTDDLIEKCRYYLSHEEERAEIARRGHDKACELFNYEKQFSTIFKTAGLKL